MDMDDLAFLMGGDLPEETAGPDWRGICVVAEVQGDQCTRATRQVLGKARELGNRLGARISAVVLGHGADAAAESLTKLGADVVYLVDDQALTEAAADLWVDALAQVVEQHKPEILLFGFTAVGREVAPRLAERLGTGLTADASDLDLDETDRLLVATRASFGGRALATITCPKARPQMATVTPNAFREAEYDPYASGDVERVSVSLDAGRVRLKVVGTQAMPTEVPLERAKVIVCVGEDIGGPEGVAAAKALAEALGAQLAGNRAACEAGLVDAGREISARGATVAPDLYIGVGVPGTIDHTDAMRQSRTVVAIHASADAPLMELADYGVAGDVKAVAEGLVAALADARAKRLAVGAR
jgi:electron transfer flavoprotein alpha subunit